MGVIDLSSVSKNQQSSILKLPSSVSKGAVVMQVTDGSAADKAGIAKYDVITELGGHRVSDAGSLKTVLYRYKVGQSVNVSYYHNGKKVTKKVQLSEANNSASTDSSSQDDDQSADDGQ